MRNLASMFAIALLVVFAAGTVVNAAGATSMSLKMSAVAMADGTMADCQDCPSDTGNSLACDQACVVPLIAITQVAGIDLPAAQTEIAVFSVREPAGHTGPPLPYPPRIITLS